MRLRKDIQFPIEEATHLYQQGLSTIEVAKHIGWPADDIYHRLERAGVSLRSRKEASELAYSSGRRKVLSLKARGITAEKVGQLYLEEKLGCPEIARVLGCDDSSIYRLLKGIGCPMRNGIGPSSPNFKGKRYFHKKSGYIFVAAPPDYYARTGRTQVREHVLVWEETHGKPLPKGWIIHHLNGIPSDNRPANLRAFPRNKHDLLIPEFKKHIRELEIEVRQLRHCLEDNQAIFYIGEN